MRRSLRVPPTDRPRLAEVRARQPGLVEAVRADARLASEREGDRRAHRGRWGLVRQVAGLAWSTDAFGALVLYRVKAAALRAGVPVVPRLAHRLAMSWAQVSIGNPVLVHPGIYLPHGNVVIDGYSEIHPGVRIRPFVTIGLVDGEFTGPTIGPDVRIGTGAKVLGPVVVGAGANIGANAVVIRDVEPGAVVGGIPARPLTSRS